MGIARSLASGFAGACTVTVLNETVRRMVPHAPRMEVIGMRALRASLSLAGVDPPKGDDLYYAAIVGDLLSNTLYYSCVGLGTPKNVWWRGTALGLAAGVGAALLPPRMHLGDQPGERTPMTQLLTVAWYLSGGLTAAAVEQMGRR